MDSDDDDEKGHQPAAAGSYRKRRAAAVGVTYRDPESDEEDVGGAGEGEFHQLPVITRLPIQHGRGTTWAQSCSNVHRLTCMQTQLVPPRHQARAPAPQQLQVLLRRTMTVMMTRPMALMWWKMTLSPICGGAGAYIRKPSVPTAGAASGPSQGGRNGTRGWTT